MRFITGKDFFYRARPAGLIVFLLIGAAFNSCSGGGGSGGAGPGKSVPHKSGKHLIGAHYYTAIERLREGFAAKGYNMYNWAMYDHPGYGTATLEAVLNKIASVCGRVMDQAGAPVWGAKVCGYKNQEQITCGATNREGYYTLSRLKMRKGEYDIFLDGKEGALRVSAGSLRISKDINFTKQDHEKI